MQVASRILEDVAIEPDHLPGVLSAFSVAQTSVTTLISPKPPSLIGHPPQSATAFLFVTTFLVWQVLAESRSMLARLGRPNYVTPTHYLELVKG